MTAARAAVLVKLSALVLLAAPAAASAPPSAIPAPTSPSTPAASSVESDVAALGAAYRALFVRVDGLAALDATRKAVLERRIVLAARSLDPDRVVHEPEILAEKARQAELDAAVVGASLGDGPLPIDRSPGLRETIVAGARPAAAAYIVPPGGVRQMLVLLPGARETDSDLASRTAIGAEAAATQTLVVVPSLDGARSVDDVAAQVASAETAFGAAFSLPARLVYLGGVSNGASLQFEIPLLTHRHFAGYLAIAGTFPGARGGEILSILRADGAAIYFVAGGRDAEVPIGNVRASVANCRGAGVLARYYGQPDGTNSIGSLAPAIAAAWQDMVSGVDGAQDDGLGAMPGDSRPG